MIEVYRGEWGTDHETLIGSVDSVEETLRLVREDTETAPNKKKLIYFFRCGAIEAVGWGSERDIISAFEKAYFAQAPHG